MDHVDIETDLRHKMLHVAQKHCIDVVYISHDESTSLWLIELRVEHTLPPNRYNTAAAHVVEAVVNRMKVSLQHDLKGDAGEADRILRKFHAIVSEMAMVSSPTYTHAKYHRVQHGG